MNVAAKLLIENITEGEPVLSFDNENSLNEQHYVNNVHAFDLSLAVDANQEAIDAAILVIDNALAECSDNPCILGSSEFNNAVKLVSSNNALWFKYRTKIKSAKPSGVPMSAIDDMAETYSGNGDKRDSTAEELIKLVLSNSELFFDRQADKAFVSTDMDGVIHTLPIDSKSFMDWLSFSFYKKTKCGNATGKFASEVTIKQACFALSGIAKHEGENQRVHLRVADHNGGHYLFIGDDQLQVIEALPTGWRIIKNSPIKFWAPGSMQSLPIPKPGGDLAQLWDFVNIPENDRLLVLAWALESFRAETPKPILALCGIQGNAKSATHDKLRQLIDNNSVNLRAAPKTVEDIFVSAGCNWLVSYENLSFLSQTMQDAFCTLATGGGHAARTFYTNAEESTIAVKRPIIINSIPNVLTAQDAIDRTISIDLPTIAYREEAQINAAWDDAMPAIFGGLMDLFVKTLALMPTVKLINPPRMADFTRLGEAMVQVLGHQPGVFDALYKSNRAVSIGLALEASPVAIAVRDMVDEYSGLSPVVFTGTMKNLLEKMNKYKQDPQFWPKSPRGLGDALRRQDPAFKTLGIDIEISKPGRQGVIVKIRKREHGEHVEHRLEEKTKPKEKSSN
ncbi:MAG: hypothetical protein ACXWT1_05175 [Methylobacter sp.]